jgi:hypothetical protein
MSRNDPKRISNVRSPSTPWGAQGDRGGKDAASSCHARADGSPPADHDKVRLLKPGLAFQPVVEMRKTPFGPGGLAGVFHLRIVGLRHAQPVLGIIIPHLRLVIGRGDYHWQHEPCWYAVRSKGNWTGDRKQTTLWSIQSGQQDAKTPHATQKPVECMRRPMQNNSGAGEAIYEPFLGSGTTLIAAETIGRVCLGIELEPRFVDVAVRRWEAFTGKEAFRSSDGRAFKVVAQDRKN